MRQGGQGVPLFFVAETINCIEMVIQSVVLSAACYCCRHIVSYAHCIADFYRRNCVKYSVNLYMIL